MEYYVKGIFVDTPSYNKLRVRKGYLLIKGGKVIKFSKEKEKDITVYDYKDKLIVPGFTDLHLHASQYAYSGTAMDLTLLDWLLKYTYPEEGKFKDIKYASKSYKIFKDDVVNSSTTRLCAFATIHTDSTLKLMDIMEKSGIVSYIGKLNINRNAPHYYIEESIEQGMKETIRWIDECNKRNYKRTYPIITPRFTPSVTDKYMEEIGKLTNERNLPFQSHLDESKNEIEWVKYLCPDAKNYSDTYDRYGVFGKNIKTVMAHCIYPNEDELKLIKDNGVYIAHCPTSNVNIYAGIAPTAYYLRHGYNVGLGSDVSGGNTLDLWKVMVMAIQQSKIRYNLIDNEDDPLNMVECLYMATVGGGSFFGKVGLFDKDYEFDAIVIDDSSLTTTKKMKVVERIERYAYKGNGQPVSKFVKGRKLY